VRGLQLQLLLRSNLNVCAPFRVPLPPQVVSAMERGGIPPNTRTAYILVRSAVNAGRMQVREGGGEGRGGGGEGKRECMLSGWEREWTGAR
jgi:hypothetical protein